MTDKLSPGIGNLNRKGRVKGSINKSTAIAKDAIATAFDRIGGVDRLVEWIKEDPKNETAFHTTIYPKLLPLHVNGTLGIDEGLAAWLNTRSQQ